MSPKELIQEEEFPQVVNLADSQANSVEADLVRANRTFITNLNAEETDLQQSIVVELNAHQVNANASLIGLSHAGSSNYQKSAIVAGRAEEMVLKDSLVGGIYCGSAQLSDGAQTGILVSGSVKSEQVRTVLLVSRQVEGNVQTMLDTRQVAIASLIAGIASGAIMLLGYFLFRKKR